MERGNTVPISRMSSFSFLLIFFFFLIIACAGCGSAGAGGGGGSTGSGRDGTEHGRLSTPVINPQGGSFKKAQNVIISCPTGAATIYYSIDGSEPAAGGTVYKNPIPVLQSLTIKANACAQGYSDSITASADFTFGANNTPQSAIEVESTTYQAIPYDGTDWYKIELFTGDILQVRVAFSQGTPSLALYDESQTQLATDMTGSLSHSVTKSGVYYFTVSQGRSVRALQRESVTYSMSLSTNPMGQCAAPVFSPGEGSYDFPLTFSLSSGTEGAAIYYTTDGSTPSTMSTKFTGASTISAPSTVKAVAVKAGLTDSRVSSATYELLIHPSPSPSPSSSPSPGGGGGGGGGGSSPALYGIVTDEAGSPIASAQVSLDYQLKSSSAAGGRKLAENRGNRSSLVNNRRDRIRGNESRAFTSRGTVRVTWTDEQGYYSFTNIESRAYVVKADKAGYLPNSENVTVGQTAVQQNIILYWKKTRYLPDFSSIHFVDSQIGWVSGYDGEIKRTTNGGATWSLETTGTYENLWSIFFVDAARGWACSENGSVLHSTDGGLHWMPQVTGTKADLRSICFSDEKNGWAAGYDWTGESSTIIHTTDGGATWNPQSSSAADITWAVHFINPNEGWIACLGGTILHTTDGGGTWNNQNKCTLGQGGYFTCIYFADKDNGWAAGAYNNSDAVICRTNDGGATWTLRTFPGSGYFNNLSFTDSDFGWIAGTDGAVFHTTDGGVTWNAQASGTPWQLLDVHFSDRSNGWISGVFGLILHTTDGGRPLECAGPGE